MDTRDSLRALEIVLRKRAIQCGACNKPVQHAEVQRGAVVNQIRIDCHGKVEIRDLTEVGRWGDPAGWLERNVPRTAFLRNWAGYTIRPERPAGRRM